MYLIADLYVVSLVLYMPFQFDTLTTIHDNRFLPHIFDLAQGMPVCTVSCQAMLTLPALQSYG